MQGRRYTTFGIDDMHEESESALRKIPEIIASLQKNLRSLTNISYTLHD